MVDLFAVPLIGQIVLFAEQAAPLLKRLDPGLRSTVLMALMALVILGAGMIVLVVLGGRWVRRLSRQRPQKRQRDASDWAAKPPRD